MNTEFTTPFGVFQLHRFPATRNASLQAWDAADEYLLNYLYDSYHDHGEAELPSPICIINDEFGALSCALAKSSASTITPESSGNNCTLVTDSLMAKTAVEKNLAHNVDSSDTNLLQITDPFTFRQPSSVFKLVVIKIPKTLALLEEQLISLQGKITPESIVIGAGKVTLVTKTVLSLFEKYIGVTVTSLAKKKSRLIFATPSSKQDASRPGPIIVEDDTLDFKLINHANVFCRDHLDIGARFFLNHLVDRKHSIDETITAVDLGCGNGVLGVSLLRQLPNSEVFFVDESSSAIVSAKATAEAAGVTDGAHFMQSHSMAALPKKLKREVDLVLCNPPFHQNNAITEEIAWQMFKDACQFLSLQGELRIVANRQLNYMVKLKKLFSSVDIIARNKKFSIYRATKR